MVAPFFLNHFLKYVNGCHSPMYLPVVRVPSLLDQTDPSDAIEPCTALFLRLSSLNGVESEGEVY